MRKGIREGGCGAEGKTSSFVFSEFSGKPPGRGPEAPRPRFLEALRRSRCRQKRRRPRRSLMGSQHSRAPAPHSHANGLPCPHGFQGEQGDTCSPRRDRARTNNSSRIGWTLINKPVGQEDDVVSFSSSQLQSVDSLTRLLFSSCPRRAERRITGAELGGDCSIWGLMFQSVPPEGPHKKKL